LITPIDFAEKVTKETRTTFSPIFSWLYKKKK